MSWSLAGGLGAIFAAVFLLALTVLGSRARAGRQRDLAGRIGRYGPRHGPGQVNDDHGAARKGGGSVALDVTRRLMSPAAQQRLSARLELAAVTRKPAEWVLLGGCVAVVTAAAVSVLTNVVIGVLVGALVGWLGMRTLLNFLIRRRRGAFAEQLPDLLQILASSLQSGFSLLQGLDAAVREAAQPAGGEFARALAEARLGGDLEDCLETVADRMASDDLRWTVMAIRIQRGIGGNLAEVLMTTVNTIRERGFLRRHVRSLTAEGRLSAYILIALPVVVGAFFFVTEPAYMRPLYTTRVGQLMLAGAVVLVIAGTAIMRQMIKIEV
ncbi:MAG TPA: type II secretion system F family protein [Streptosporangiaceae bacterium]|nr:type II secretion system F family protein [Streptosporangiaceae bacterium]